jgi:hypothetical protein
MIYMPIEKMPMNLKQSISRTIDAHHEAFEILQERASATKDGLLEFYPQMAEFLSLSPSNSKFAVVGGHSGFVGMSEMFVEFIGTRPRGCGQKRNPVCLVRPDGSISGAKPWTKTCGCERGVDSGQQFFCRDCLTGNAFIW